MASINIKKDGQWTGKPVLGFKVGEENLTDELKEKIANGADVDLSGYATKEELEALTAADVGARPDTWLPTAADIGAAPAGYGLGGNAKLLTSTDNLDNITENGWYAWSDIPQGFSYGGCVMQVKNLTADWLVQEITILVGNTAGCKIIRNCLGGEWQPLEWDNPPMTVGVEYRTTERWNSKAVYSKIVDCGNLPHTTTKTVAHGITGATAFVAVRLISGYNGVYFETVNGGDSAMISGANIQIKTTWSAAAYTSYAFLKYVKD